MLTVRGDAVVMQLPADVFATGFEEPAGLAVDHEGAVVVSDRKAGTLTRVLQNGSRQILLQNLDRPGAITINRHGIVFVTEADARVVALEPNGVLSVAWADAKRPRAIAAGPDGRLWLLVRAQRGPHFDLVRHDAPGVITRIASGFRGARALAVDGSAAYIAFDSVSPAGYRRTTVGRVPLDADSTARELEPVLQRDVVDAQGLALDAAGDLLVSGTAAASGAGVLLKRRGDGRLSILPATLEQPGALAIAQDGSLFAIEAATGSVVVLRAPAAPKVTLPPFTNATPVRVTGTAQVGSLVQVYTGPGTGEPAASALASQPAGGFAVDVRLQRNDQTRLLLVATGSGGAGLRGATAAFTTIHDDGVPVVRIEEPAPGIHVRDAVVARVTANDEASGVAEMRVLVDETVVAVMQNPAPPRSLSSSVTVGRGLADGPHSLSVTATDQAGNSTSAAQLFVVDRTPPDTYIVVAPAAEIAGPDATFTFAGSDGQSSGVEFSWRLDGQQWSAFGAATTVSLTTLAAGPHRFEVRSRDYAGNEDVTPAVHTFRVMAFRVRVLEPGEGTVVTSSTVWVRGVVEGGGEAVAVTVPLAPDFGRALSLDAVHVRVVAGSFAVEVPVVPGMTSIAVLARTADGISASADVGITIRIPLLPALRAEAFPPAGLAPLVVRFPASGFPAGSVYTLDVDNDGTPEYEGSDLAEQEFVYSRAGVYMAALQVVPPGGQSRTARTAIEVYDRAALDARLQAAWSAFRAALRSGDTAAAASFVHSERRTAWQQHLARLTPSQLAAADAVFTAIALVEVAPGRAECEMLRDVGGLLYSFPVSFAIDVDGGWRLWQF
jgi:hypothetical protein